MYKIRLDLVLLIGACLIFAACIHGINIEESLSRTYDLDAPIKTWVLDHRPGKLKTDDRFRGLVQTKAIKATPPDSNKFVLGTYIFTNDNKRDIIEFLILNGVPDVRIHLGATVHLMEDGEDDFGYWCRIVARALYCTNKCSERIYDFGIRICPDGTILLMNANKVRPYTDVSNPDKERK
jgi:hypothetical protein